MAKKILVALSGGVDSSTTAYLLKSANLDVSAVYIKFFALNQEQKKIIEKESQIVQAIAQSLNIPLHILDYSQEQKITVIDYLLSSYQRGQTPNPCIVCNKLLKFGQLLDWAKKEGFSHLATGHYAQIINQAGRLYLASAQDQTKDQSYFLYQLTEEQLAHLLFPLGSLNKNRVREIAKQANFKQLNRESFDICFLRNSSLTNFLHTQLKQNPGKIVDQDGLVIGQHQGLAFYTIGQRRGLSINHQALKHSKNIIFIKNRPPALLVINKIPEKNQLVVAEPKACFFSMFALNNLHFVNQDQQKQWLKRKKLYCLVKIRNSGKLVPCQIVQEGQNILVKAKNKIFAPASGQAAVFYQENQKQLLLIAGATIDNEFAKS